MARNGVGFTSHFPVKNQAVSYQSSTHIVHNNRRFAFTYDDLYNCLYRHNEPQLIDIEAFKAQRKTSQADGDRSKEATSKSTFRKTVKLVVLSLSFLSKNTVLRAEDKLSFHFILHLVQGSNDCCFIHAGHEK